jgi:hypothetical protein
MSHVSTEDLVAYVENRLAGSALQAAMSHLEGCMPCKKELRSWTDLFETLNGSQLQDAPAYAVRNCMAIYQIRKPVSAFRQVLANLVFDSFREPLLAGVRGPADAQQLLLQGEGVDLHLRVSHTPPAIVGQLLQRSATPFVSGARLSIIKQGIPVETTVSDALGEFRFREVPQGAIRVEAELPSNVKLIGEFTVHE